LIVLKTQKHIEVKFLEQILLNLTIFDALLLKLSQIKL